jgi:hypothetical protein
MGWTGHKLPDNDWLLFNRGGLKGVYISDDKNTIEIHIPEELLIMLAADQVRNAKISQLEQTSDREILGLKEED